MTNLRHTSKLWHMSKITTAEAAQILGVSVRTVHRKADAGEIPHEMKLPGPRGAYVFDEATVRELAKAEAVNQ